jgi:hypothetical protein
MLEIALMDDLDLLSYLVLGFFCGIRPVDELNLLQWSDVDLQGKSVTIRSYCLEDKATAIPRALRERCCLVRSLSTAGRDM